MNTFLYFWPSRKALPSDSWGALEYLRDPRVYPQNAQLVQHGPDSHTGLLWGMLPEPHAGKVRYVPQEQTWIYHEAAGVYVGLWNDPALQPKPADLQRQTVLAGAPVRDEQGHAWLAPIARQHHATESERYADYSTLLPQVYGLEGNGFTQRVVARWQELWDLSELCWQARFGLAMQRIEAEEAGQGFTHRGVLSEEIIVAVKVIQANYRLGICEASLLQMLTDPWLHGVLDTFNEIASFTEYAKKKRAALASGSVPNAGQTSCNGLADDLPTTAPPAATSIGSPPDGINSHL